MKHLKTLSILLISLLLAFSNTSNVYGQKELNKNTKSDPNIPIFEVKNDLGQTVFAVYPGGVRVFVNDQLKAAGGGFTVGRLSTGKALTGDIFSVVPNNVNVYIDAATGVKAAGGGFTVGRLSTGKAVGDENFLTVTPDSTRVYINETSSAGFAVGKLGTTTGLQKFMLLRKDNYFIGHNSGTKTTGLYNLFLGYESGLSNTTGKNNTFIGYQTGYNNVAGFDNVFIGYQAAYNNVGDGGGFSGTYNVMVGHKAGFSNTSGGGHVIMGYNAATQVTTSNYMTAIGYNAGAGATGSYNVFMGGEAGKQFGLGDYNTCVGMSAGVAAAGTGNSYYGASAGWHNDGSNNTAIGRAAGYGANTFAYNNGTYLGAFSGVRQTTGSNNTFIGYSAGRNSTVGAGNVFLGFSAGYNETGSNKLYISNSNTATPLIYGEFDTQLMTINGSLNVTGDICGTTWCSSDIRLKSNIETILNPINIIKKIRGVSYRWDKSISKNLYKNDDKQIGVIAQEVEKVLPELVKTQEDGYKVVAYDKLTAVLIEAVKEQQKQIEELKEKNKALSQQVSGIDLLKTEMNELKAMVKEISDTQKESTSFSSK